MPKQKAGWSVRYSVLIQADSPENWRLWAVDRHHCSRSCIEKWTCISRLMLYLLFYFIFNTFYIEFTFTSFWVAWETDVSDLHCQWRCHQSKRFSCFKRHITHLTRSAFIPGTWCWQIFIFCRTTQLQFFFFFFFKYWLALSHHESSQAM